MFYYTFPWVHDVQIFDFFYSLRAEAVYTYGELAGKSVIFVAHFRTDG